LRRLLRIIHGDCNPQGPGVKAEPVAKPFEGGYRGREQAIHAGCYVRAPHHESCERLGTYARGDNPADDARQGRAGHRLQVGRGHARRRRLEVGEDGGLSITLGDGRGGSSTIGTGRPMLARRWYVVAASYDPAAGVVTLVQRPVKATPGTMPPRSAPPSTLHPPGRKAR
jgi:N,N-dimethylformamidase